MHYFSGISIVLCTVSAVAFAAIAPGQNAYLPPTKDGYSYNKPSVPFASAKPTGGSSTFPQATRPVPTGFQSRPTPARPSFPAPSQPRPAATTPFQPQRVPTGFQKPAGSPFQQRPTTTYQQPSSPFSGSSAPKPTGFGGGGGGGYQAPRPVPSFPAVQPAASPKPSASSLNFGVASGYQSSKPATPFQTPARPTFPSIGGGVSGGGFPRPATSPGPGSRASSPAYLPPPAPSATAPIPSRTGGGGSFGTSVSQSYQPVSTPGGGPYPNRPQPQGPRPSGSSFSSNVAQTSASHDHHDDHHHHEPGMPFDFNYSVNDAQYGNEFSHNAVSDGDVTTGEYRIQLPDGRVQVVKYTADWKTGFHAQVRYEGEINYQKVPVFRANPVQPAAPFATAGGAGPTFGAARPSRPTASAFTPSRPAPGGGAAASSSSFSSAVASQYGQQAGGGGSGAGYPAAGASRPTPSFPSSTRPAGLSAATQNTFSSSSSSSKQQQQQSSSSSFAANQVGSFQSAKTQGQQYDANGGYKY